MVLLAAQSEEVDSLESQNICLLQVRVLLPLNFMAHLPSDHDIMINEFHQNGMINHSAIFIKGAGV